MATSYRSSTAAKPSWTSRPCSRSTCASNGNAPKRPRILLQKRNLPYEHFGKIKRQIAAEKAFGLGDEGLDWMTTQMIESFMQSPHVEEVFADDATLRKKMTDILKKHMQIDDEIDAEVRRRIKNLEEGTATWEVEYQKALDQIKKNRRLDE